jgi:hypothetical protein
MPWSSAAARPVNNPVDRIIPPSFVGATVAWHFFIRADDTDGPKYLQAISS